MNQRIWLRKQAVTSKTYLNIVLRTSQLKMIVTTLLTRIVASSHYEITMHIILTLFYVLQIMRIQ